MFILLIFAAAALGSHAPSRLVQNARAEESTGRETQSHAAVITPGPSLRNQLQRRSPETCAYVHGDSCACPGRFLGFLNGSEELISLNFIALPLVCPDGYNCVNTLGVQPAWACCNEIECTENWGLCNEYGASGCNGVDLDAAVCSSIYGSILRWFGLQLLQSYTLLWPRRTGLTGSTLITCL